MKNELPDDHSCPYRDLVPALQQEIGALHAELARLQAQMAALNRRTFGPRSERMPELRREVQKGQEPDPEALRKRRREATEAKLERVEQTQRHTVPEADRICETCGGSPWKELGEGESSVTWEYQPGRLVGTRHLRQKLACACGESVVTAPVPDKVFDKSHYGPSLVAWLGVSKTADHLPFYRLEKICSRMGVPLSRSTMGDLFHRAAERLRPLYEQMMKEMAAEEIVQADETTLKVQAAGKTRTAWAWAFLGGGHIGYKFSPSRSGETPRQVLGASTGTLLVDAFTGYNFVTRPNGRVRSGCLAHVRRKFFEARSTTPEAQEAMNLLLEVYRVEHEALERGIVGKPAHLALRQEKSVPAMAAFNAWLEAQEGKWLPKGPMAKAVAHALHQWEALTHFLTDARIPVDNNASERAMRVVALGRKNFLFVGHDEAGQNLAIWYSLVATCEAHGIHPIEYLADVLMRVQDARPAEYTSLLPQKWAQARGERTEGAAESSEEEDEEEDEDLPFFDTDEPREPVGESP